MSDELAEIERDIARCAELLHQIETVEQEHAEYLRDGQRDDLRDEIEQSRRRINRLRTRLTRLKAGTPGVNE